MPLNGSEWMDHPWNTTLKGFTDIFFNTTGSREALWLFILIVLTFAIWKTSKKNPLYTSMFMICASACLTTGGLFMGAPIMAAIFSVFVGIGIASMFVSLYFQRR